MKKVVVLLLCIMLSGCAYAENKTEDVVLESFPIRKDFIDLDKLYLSIGEESAFDVEVNYCNCISSNEDIVRVDGNVVRAIGEGKVEIACSISKFYYDTFTVESSNYYTYPHIDNNKPYLEEGMYTKEENDYLDGVLERMIKEAGYGTRAGVVEAARFLALRFPYRIAYFYENGRMYRDDLKFSKVDGEGRYYHKGLYLDESRYEDIYKSVSGPATWGKRIYSYTVNSTMRNGLDCSGYVSWAMLNGGFDCGDVGAGYTAGTNFDLDDIGKKVAINSNTVDKIKVGDFMSRYGHIGILIGKDEEHFYVAEELDTDLHVLTYDRSTLLRSGWTNYIDMDEYYGNDGNLTDMW